MKKPRKIIEWELKEAQREAQAWGLVNCELRKEIQECLRVAWEEDEEGDGMPYHHMRILKHLDDTSILLTRKHLKHPSLLISKKEK